MGAIKNLNRVKNIWPLVIHCNMLKQDISFFINCCLTPACVTYCQPCKIYKGPINSRCPDSVTDLSLFFSLFLCPFAWFSDKRPLNGAHFHSEDFTHTLKPIAGNLTQVHTDIRMDGMFKGTIPPKLHLCHHWHNDKSCYILGEQTIIYAIYPKLCHLHCVYITKNAHYFSI